MNRQKVHKRIRAKIEGTSVKPRLSVFRSGKHIYAQLIDDQKGVTLFASSNVNIKKKKGIVKSELAKLVGEDIAGKAIAKNIKQVVFDRGGFRYHGRVKQLADGARAGGLEF